METIYSGTSTYEGLDLQARKTANLPQHKSLFQPMSVITIIFVIMTQKQVSLRISTKRRMMFLELKREIIRKHDQEIRVIDLTRECYS